MSRLDPEAKDLWGIPALRINCAWRENERALLEGHEHQRGRDARGSGRDQHHAVH